MMKRRYANTRTAALRFLVAASLLQIGALGCTGGDGDGDGDGDGENKEVFECELGVLDLDGEFIPASEDARAELDLGFQGFLFAEVHIQANGLVPDVVDAATLVTISGEDPGGGTTPDISMELQEDQYMTEPVLLFFNSSTPADLAGRTAEVVIKLEDDAHECTTEGTILLVDDDPCIHTGDEPICPDDPDQESPAG